MTNVLPINKIFLAGFAFVLTHWRKIGEISILPLLMSLPFLWILPKLLEELSNVVLNSEILPEITLPDNIFIYSVLFIYGYFMLSINTYRLVVLGEQSVNAWKPITNLPQIARFMLLHFLIGLLTILPIMLTKIEVLYLIMYFLIVPITLNFVNIAINQPTKYRWNLSFITQVNLFFLQVILPTMVGFLFNSLTNFLNLGLGLAVVVKIIIFYWTLVTLSLCYQLLQTSNTAR